MLFFSKFILPFLIAFVISFLFTYLIRALALNLKIVDKPLSSRKIHKKAIPLLGGAALFLGFGLTLFYFAFFTDWIFGGYMLPKHIIGILVAGLILIFGGVLDDKFNLSPKKQFIWPVLASLVIVASGIGINFISNPLGEAFQLDQLKIKVFEFQGVPYFIVLLADLFTLVWLLGMTYTTKFLDGLDGLVSGIAVIASFILFFLSLESRVMQPETALVCIILAGAALGFLIWNFYPAKIFLGEGGSTFVGFTLGTLSIISGGKIATALLIFGIPILDVLWVILRRLWYRKSPFKTADKKHLHFRLLDLGFSHRGAVLFLYAISLTFGTLALFLQGREKVLALLALCGLMLVLATVLVLVYKFKKSQRA
jgi:UDP-GlcNAc:undecaprenyl-phosphate GlcNAc-1-phosphate transferase